MITPLVSRIWRLVFIILFVALSGLFSFPSSALEKGPKRVLVLHSYHPGLHWTNTINSAIEEVFKEAGGDIQIHVEFLDAKRYHDRQYFSQIEALFQHKLAKPSFDLLLLSDNDALNFALKHRHDLFQDTPIVFCGINNYQPSMLSGYKGITGIAETVAPRETIELALRLHPETEEIVAINSTRDVTGREIRDLFLADMPRYRDRVRFTLWDDLPLEEVQARLTRLPPGRLVFLNGIISDRAGRVFSYVEGMRRIRRASPVPLYGYWDFFLGQGIVGGKLISGTLQGRLAAHVALRILGGENPDDLAVIYSGANAYMFDYPELERFDVPLELLPENSIVINKPHPFYQISKKQFWAGLAVMAVLTVITGALVLNILSRRRAEKALRESQQKFQRIFDHSFQFFGLIKPDGELMEVNRAVCEFFRIDAAEVLGKPFWDTPWSHTPDVQRQLRDAVKRAAEGDIVRFETEHPDFTGNMRYFDCSLKPITDERGKVTLLIPEGRDITERKRAEKALRESELFYRQTLESVPGMAFTTRPDGYIEYRSQQWVDFTGVPLDEHLGDGWNKMLHPGDRELAFNAWRDAVEERAPYDLEYRVRRYDGEYEWFKVRGLPIRNEAGEIVRWFGTALNIDQLVRAREELRQAKAMAEAATRAKSEFLANMSHEIRTPMTVFLAAIEHLLQLEKTPEQRKLLEMADKSARRLRDLINDVLDFSRIEARRVELEEEPFDLRSCVSEVVEMFALTARQKNLRLEVVVAPDTPGIVVGAPARLGQVLINLVGNAVKFTQQGEVRVRVRPSGDRLQFSVADTGIGIPEEKRHLLFQSFSQVDPSFYRRYGGSGLGLAISQGLVELMGGRIEVQNRQGGGSIFSFTLPLKAAAGRSIHPPETSGKENGKKCRATRILLADDEPMIRELITTLLSGRSWHMETAGTGREAIKKWEQGDFDLVLMDLQMPEMDGLEATREIRKKEGEGARRICIIGLTAHARSDIWDDCLAAGMDDVLIKPVQMDDLYSVIDRRLPG